MVRLMKQLIFGWDTSIGVWAFVLLSFLFNQPASLWVLMVAGFCAYLPDLDFIPFLALRRRFNVTVGHWVFGHYPIIVLPLEAAFVGIITSIAWPGHVIFLVTLVLVCTSGHFIHDASALPYGFQLLAPITKDGRVRFPIPLTEEHPMDLYTHYRIGWGKIIGIAPRELTQKMYDDCEDWTKSGGSEIGGRVEPVTTYQITAFWLGIAGIVILVIKNGLTWPF